MHNLDLLPQTADEFVHRAAVLLPNIAVALGIIILGWLIAKVARFAVERALRAVNFNVLTLQSRIPPSSCELSTRSCIGHRGHGVEGERVSGGFGSSSNCVTDAAPCRWLVPTQSAPVSPPPMMITCLPVARICPLT